VTKIEVGDQLYEVSVGITKVTEFGVGIIDAMSPDVVLPPSGARFDIAVAGTVRGSKIEGTFEGVDYLHVRADRRSQLHIHGAITTPAGAIALFADGVALPDETQPGIFQLRENVTLTTAVPEFEWVNQLQVWGQGTVDMNALQIEITGFVA
jgi:hypothetical protein